jgi:hypothetical protein
MFSFILEKTTKILIIRRRLIEIYNILRNFNQAIHSRVVKRSKITINIKENSKIIKINKENSRWRKIS